MCYTLCHSQEKVKQTFPSKVILPAVGMTNYHQGHISCADIILIPRDEERESVVRPSSLDEWDNRLQPQFCSVSRPVNWIKPDTVPLVPPAPSSSQVRQAVYLRRAFFLHFHQINSLKSWGMWQDCTLWTYASLSAYWVWHVKAAIVRLLLWHIIVCVFYWVNQIKYNTILFYIIYKRERLKRYR